MTDRAELKKTGISNLQIIWKYHMDKCRLTTFTHILPGTGGLKSVVALNAKGMSECWRFWLSHVQCQSSNKNGCKQLSNMCNVHLLSWLVLRKLISSQPDGFIANGQNNYQFWVYDFFKGWQFYVSICWWFLIRKTAQVINLRHMYVTFSHTPCFYGIFE